MFSPEEVTELVKKAADAAYGRFVTGRYQDAEIILGQALKVNPCDPKSLQLMGLTKHKLGKFTEGIEYLNRAIATDPANPENYNNIGLCYANEGQYEKAIEFIQKAIGLKANNYFFSNLGLQYRHLQQYDLAIDAFKKSIEVEESAIAWTMLGGVYGELKDLGRAEQCFLQALRIKPNFGGAHVDIASVYQIQGRWKEAWEHFEWRKEVHAQLALWKMVYDPKKLWDGKQPGRILVHNEQGHGDTIHFFRYIRLLRERGFYVIFHCDECLGELFKDQVDELYTTDPTKMLPHDRRTDGPEHDWHCSLLSLPYLLDAPPIPSAPYLHIDRSISLDAYSNSYKIGVVWAGNPQHPNDRYRSCSLECFRKIHDLPGVKLFSLVKDLRPRIYRFQPEPIDLAAGTDDMKIVDMSPMLNSFADTAAILNSLDLVISVDTATLHLAGAMGRPAWGLIPWNADWRWGLEGEKTVWYPSVRLFRQPTLGDWGSVFSELEREIHNEQRLR